MAKTGKIYYVDVEFTDAQVAAQFAFPCMFFLRNADGHIIKHITYDLNGEKSVANYSSPEDKVLTLGTITATTTTLALDLHSSGVNSVLMSGVVRSKTEGDDFTFAPVSAGKLKYVLLYALPDPQLFHIIEGVEGNEAIYPDLPPGALLIKAVLISEFGALLEDADGGYKPLAEDPWRNIVINSNAAVNIIVASSPSASFNVLVGAGVTAPKIAAIKTKVKKNTRDGQEITFYNDSDIPVALLPGDYEETLVYTTFPFADNYEIKPRSFAKFKRKENKYHELAGGGSASFPEGAAPGDVLTEGTEGPEWSNRLTNAETAIALKLEKPTTDGSWVVTKSGATITYTDASTFGQNIANTNLTWSADRTQNLNAKKLSFTGGRFSVPALELEITAENSVPNKIWTDGVGYYFNNNLGIKKRVAIGSVFIYTPTGNFTLSQVKVALEATGMIFNDAHIIVNLGSNNYTCSIDIGATNPNTLFTIARRGNGSISFTSTRTLNSGTDTITIINGNESSIALIQMSDTVDFLTIRNK